MLEKETNSGLTSTAVAGCAAISFALLVMGYPPHARGAADEVKHKLTSRMPALSDQHATQH